MQKKKQQLKAKKEQKYFDRQIFFNHYLITHLIIFKVNKIIEEKLIFLKK
jgi:hypothetical protein